MFSEIIFDVETQKFFDEVDSRDPGALGVSIVSVYSRKLDENFKEIEGTMQSFWEDEIDRMWPLFQGKDRIIGFNSIGFDVPVLSPYEKFPLANLPHFDILANVKEVLGHRISLDALAKETLRTKKIDHGARAVEYWRKGDKESLSKLKKYCEADVIITRDLYDHGLHEKILRFKDKWNTPRQVEVDFSYPPQDMKQDSLF